MDHRLPVTLLLVACASDPTARETASPRGDTGTSGTTIPYIHQGYRFEWDMDGEVQIVGASWVNMVEAHADGCESSWGIAVVPNSAAGESLPLLSLRWTGTEPLQPGQQAAVGDASTGDTRSSVLRVDETGEYYVHSPSWTLSVIELNQLEFIATEGEYCSVFDRSDCRGFGRLSIRLVDSDLPFDPSFAWCEIAPRPNPGEPCGGGSGPDGDPDRDALYEPCP